MLDVFSLNFVVDTKTISPFDLIRPLKKDIRIILRIIIKVVII